MEAKKAHAAAARRASALALCAAALLAGCGGNQRQDADEDGGDYRVEVVSATFPVEHKLAKRAVMRIVVKNADSKAIPNIAVTVKGFDSRVDNPTLADQNRPRFVVNQAPRGGDAAHVGTSALGRLEPGQTKTFTWNVTAVKAGRFDLRWTVAAGLHGKAKAVLADGGGQVTGSFPGKVEDEAPDVRVAKDGKTVVSESEQGRKRK